MTKRAPELFAGILEVQNGFANGEAVMSGVKSMVNDVKDVWSGAAMERNLTTIRNSMKQMIPGKEIVDTAVGGTKKVVGKVAGKVAEEYLKANGVPASVAKMGGKQLEKRVADSTKTAQSEREKAQAERDHKEAEAVREAMSKEPAHPEGGDGSSGSSGSGSSGGSSSSNSSSSSSSGESSSSNSSSSSSGSGSSGSSSSGSSSGSGSSGSSSSGSSGKGGSSGSSAPKSGKK